MLTIRNAFPSPASSAGFASILLNFGLECSPPPRGDGVGLPEDRGDVRFDASVDDVMVGAAAPLPPSAAAASGSRLYRLP